VIVSRFKGKIAGIALGGVALSVLFAPASALAIGVLDAYSLALQKDPTFLAALKEKEAGDENKNIGLAGLLPKVSLNYQNSPKNWQKVTSPQAVNIFSNETIDVTTRQQYRSYSGSVTLTQPLIDYAAYARYRSGVAQTLMSDERFRGKFMDLAVRVVSAYVDVAYARDQIALAEAQKTAYQEQLALNDRLLNAGEGTVTDVSETQARFSLAEAQAIEARDALDAAQRELEVMIGRRWSSWKHCGYCARASLKWRRCCPPALKSGGKWPLRATRRWRRPARAWTWRSMRWSATGAVFSRRCSFMRLTLKTIPAAITRSTRSTGPTVSAFRSACRFMPAAALPPRPGRPRPAMARRCMRWTRRSAPR